MSDDVQTETHRRWGIVLFGAIFVLMVADLAVDFREGSGLAHVLAEALVLLCAGLGLWVLLARYGSQRQALAQAQEDSAHWRSQHQSLIAGLGQAISTQFDAWELTTAEAEIAILVLKGLSLREIGALRGTSERTVREQARAVYRKSGLAGRTELAAFFLEDLLLPDASDEKSPVAPASG